MAKKKFLDEDGLKIVAQNIPQIIAGDNITITPDSTKSNKITISSDISSALTYADTSDINALFT